jgi:hypothetical protein
MAVTHKKTFEIVKAGKKNSLKLDDGRVVKFKKNGTFHTDDAGLAKAINERYGHETKRGDGSAVVCELEKYNETRLRTRKEAFAFTVPALPWHRYDEEGKRIR